jgi:hypothetical protein
MGFTNSADLELYVIETTSKKEMHQRIFDLCMIHLRFGYCTRLNSHHNNDFSFTFLDKSKIQFIAKANNTYEILVIPSPDPKPNDRAKVIRSKIKELAARSGQEERDTFASLIYKLSQLEKQGLPFHDAIAKI